MTVKMMRSRDIQYLIDERAGYGRDDYSRSILDKLSIEKSSKHLFNRKSLYSYIREYSDTVAEVFMSGADSKTRYSEDDILRMLDDPLTQARMDFHMRRKTVELDGKRVPKVVADAYRKELAESPPAAGGIHEEIIKLSTNDLLKIMRTVANELNRREDEIEQQKEREAR